jgi:putative tryptophan/tyrosine transport system substrate-binding protein
VEIEGRKLGMTLTPIAVRRPDHVEQALARVAKEHPGALWVVPVGPIAAHVRQIIAFATKERLPTIFPARFFVDAGGLMSYG